MSRVINFFKKTQNMFQGRYYLTYTVIFIFSIFLVFGCFWFTGKSLVFWGDAWNQHFKAAIYYAKWLKSIVKGLIFSHVLTIPTFSFSIGYQQVLGV